MRTEKAAAIHHGPTTPVDRGAPRWSELATRGAVVVPSFLDEADLAVLRADFTSQALNPNKNLSTKEVSPAILARLRPKLEAAAAAVRASTPIQVDAITGGSYFAISLGVNEPWHQDHESFFLFQEHFHYLNFWIPIDKPDPERTNLCFVPLDALAARAPAAAAALIGGGAAHCAIGQGRSEIHLDERGGRLDLDFEIGAIAEVPAVSAGDLVLLRGDVFHRTQDASTRRIAVSFRMINAQSVVRKRRLLEGGPIKRRMLLRNPFTYAKALTYFNKFNRGEVFVGELLAYMINGKTPRRAAVVALAELVVNWRGV